LTPLMKMHTLGHDFVPDPIHAGKLILYAKKVCLIFI
jgi:predicted alternative tryptophan synthase beta-subunit